MEAFLKTDFSGQNALILWASSFILLVMRLKGELLCSQESCWDPSALHRATHLRCQSVSGLHLCGDTAHIS